MHTLSANMFSYWSLVKHLFVRSFVCSFVRPSFVRSFVHSFINLFVYLLTDGFSILLDGGMSLLKHPSAAMTKLISSVDRQSENGERALQRPVMEFIIQRHDLDNLQLAMRQALRKAACRVFAMQVSSFTVCFQCVFVRCWRFHSLPQYL